jgi:hypothetical protein
MLRQILQHVEYLTLWKEGDKYLARVIIKMSMGSKVIEAPSLGALEKEVANFVKGYYGYV